MLKPPCTPKIVGYYHMPLGVCFNNFFLISEAHIYRQSQSYRLQSAHIYTQIFG